MFYEIVIILDGCAEARGMPAPKNHKSRRALVKRHLPHLAEMYNDLYALSSGQVLRRAQHGRRRGAQGCAMLQGASREHSSVGGARFALAGAVDGRGQGRLGVAVCGVAWKAPDGR